jgi:hypothetical protein
VCQVPAIYPGPCDDLPVHPPYAAYLRVYEPLAAFEEAERGWWERYAAESRAPDPRTGPAVERDAGLSRALAGGPWVPGEKDLPEHAYTLDVDGQLLVCPWRTAVRAWAAAGELPDIMPAELALAMLPQPQLSDAAQAYSGWRAAHPGRRVHIQTHRWAVPVRWFVLFEESERVCELGAERSVRYRAEMAAARRRVARGLSVLRRTMQGSPAAAGVEDLGRWLEEFHPRSMVELDYGALVLLLDDEALTTDKSARDVADALSALARGDASGAAAAYDRIITRWQTVSFVESAN